uniref:atrial natriuretic peptide receptor 1-like isoform X1 n=3 Tax=Ciona intestinalis TaxID=7719 RepID=UPI00089DAF6A|nr:atrial natriuretic peptide receptor 1-like isoform X1 [Ciona intestinalis]|eukprot:XP_018671934.1 atrial natriuretic peptide receptor 1-like isoform X1 [Ciona intestinalis]
MQNHIFVNLFVSYVILMTLTGGGTVGQNQHKCNINPGFNVTYKFNFWVMVPFLEPYKFGREKVIPAVERALLDAVEASYRTYGLEAGTILNSSFHVKYENTECDADVAPNVASDIHDVSLVEENCTDVGQQSRDIDVLVGMSCDYTSGRVATLANHWNWPVVYPGTRTSTLNNKDQKCCETLTRTGITATDAGKFVVKLFQHFDWNTSVVVYSNYNSHGAHLNYDLSTDCGTMLKGVTDEFIYNDWTKYTNYNILSRTTDSGIEDDVTSILQEVSDSARVSIWCVGRQTMRRVMQAAQKMGMTDGEFSFIYLDFYNTNTSYNWSSNDDHMEASTANPSVNETINDQETLEALRALQVVTLRTPTNTQYQRFSDDIKRTLELVDTPEYGQYVNPFIAHYYDSVLLVINAILQSICSGQYNFDNGREFSRRLWNMKIESLGRNVTFAANGDRILDYSLMDMDPATGIFKVALNYYANTERFEEVSAVDWPGEVVPLNVPYCGYQNENCLAIIKPDNTIYYIIGACAGAILISCAVTTFLFRKMRREKRLRMMVWKIKWEEIEWSTRRRNSSGGSRDSSQSITSSNGHPAVHFKQLFTKTGVYKGNIVSVKELGERRVSLARSDLMELESLYAMDHEHICKFIGANEEPPHVTILSEYCSRGSLQDLLEDATEYEMDDVFKYSLICDIVKGMTYLHRSFFQCHGNLKSSNCLIDSRFVVKLTDFGLSKFRDGSRTDSKTGFKYYENKLWTAPELLRLQTSHGTQKGDVYSFAIIVQEIMYRKGVFYTKEEVTAQNILHYVTSPKSGEAPFRPMLDDDDDTIINPALKKLVRKCWTEFQNERPTFQEIHREMRKFYKERNLVDSLLERLEQYSQHLEDKVEERTEQFKAEKERADSLLYLMLPRPVADRLKKGFNVLPTSFREVTIFFSDIVGFTAISHNSEPMQVVTMLNDLYTMFDTIIDIFDVYKVETIGDAYMVVSGLPQENGDNHVREIARMSLNLIKCVTNDFKIRHMPDKKLQLRVGMHTGPVVAGVVGLKMPRYCLFGDTVNTASRMESNGKPLAIHVSPKSKEVLDRFGTFQLAERDDEVFLKGLGTWKTWWLVGEDCDDEEVEAANISAQQMASYRVQQMGKVSNTSSRISGSSGYNTSTEFEVEDYIDDGRRRSSNLNGPKIRNVSTVSADGILQHNRRHRYSDYSIQNFKHRDSVKGRRTGLTVVPEVAVTEHGKSPREIRKERMRQRLRSLENNAAKDETIDVEFVSRKVQFEDNKLNVPRLPKDSGIEMYENVAFVHLRDNTTEESDRL